MKNALAIGTLVMMLFLSACGAKMSESTPPAAPDVPEEHEVQMTSVPSPQPENSEVPVTQTAAPETEPPVQTAETAPMQTSEQNQVSAPVLFTGVMGSEFVVPEGFIQLDESPNIGYQYTFWHPDHEIRIVVYEIAPGYIPEGAYETDHDIAAKNPDVTYFNEGEKWFVQSGYNQNGEEIFYSKESTTDSGLKTFWITYPTAKREFGDSITAEFEKNFKF